MVTLKITFRSSKETSEEKIEKKFTKIDKITSNISQDT